MAKWGRMVSLRRTGRPPALSMHIAAGRFTIGVQGANLPHSGLTSLAPLAQIRRHFRRSRNFYLRTGNLWKALVLDIFSLCCNSIREREIASALSLLPNFKGPRSPARHKQSVRIAIRREKHVIGFGAHQRGKFRIDLHERFSGREL